MENYKFLNLNEFTEYVIKNNELEALNPDFEKFNSYCITENNLLNFIKKSIRFKDVRNIICDVFEVVDSNSITYKVFKYIKKYPYKKVKKTIIMYLSHKEIPDFILDEICCLDFYPEAFFKLFFTYIIKSDVTPENLITFREKHSMYFNDLEEISMALKYHKEIPDEILNCIIKTYNISNFNMK